MLDGLARRVELPAGPRGTTPGQDRPTWDATTGVLVGNAARTTPRGVGLVHTDRVPRHADHHVPAAERVPVYQTWFANKTSSLSGTATLDGEALPDTLVTVTAPNGTEYTTTTDGQGRTPSTR